MHSQTAKEILDKLLDAIHSREHFEYYPEHPKAYPAELSEQSESAYKALLNTTFSDLESGTSNSTVGEEVSPYTGEALGIQYPFIQVNDLIEQAKSGAKEWRRASVLDRAAVCLEAWEKIKEQFFVIAHATQHTTGQSFMMSFQASGPHAADRAMESIALGYSEQSRFPYHVHWKKPMGKFDIELEKTFRAIPKGISVAIGCSTFPTWNTVPGMFASLVTGNPVIVKPHPKAVLPIAIVVKETQKALKEAGFDPLLVQLAPDSSEQLIAKELCEHDEVSLIDYTGGSAFGDYVESLSNKTVFTEKAGVNTVILDSVDDLGKVFQNLSFAVSLYSGQMCTAPQNFFIPEGGIKQGDTHIPFDEVVSQFKTAVEGLVKHPKMGAGTLGAIQNPDTAERVEQAKTLGAKVILSDVAVENPEYENCRLKSPIILEVEADKHAEIYEKELFGPIIIIVKTKDTNHSINLAQKMGKTHGAITCAAYTTDPETELVIYDAMESVFVPVSMNLTGFIWVNQHAAFSDFHVTGGNPAGNATFTNPEYVSKRFVWVGHRKVNA